MRRFRFPLLPDAVRWLGVLACLAVITYFSLVTVTPGPSHPGPLWDKKLHFSAYFGLGLALAYATVDRVAPRTRRVVLVFVAAVCFGVLIELLQGPLPNRDFSYLDMVADAIGALLATGWFLVETRLQYVPVWWSVDDH